MAKSLLTSLLVWLVLNACSPSIPVSGQQAKDLLISNADMGYQYVKDGDKTIDMVDFYRDVSYMKDTVKKWRSAFFASFVPKQFETGVPSTVVENMVWVFTSPNDATQYYRAWLTPLYGARFTSLANGGLSFSPNLQERKEYGARALTVELIGDEAKGWWTVDGEAVVMFRHANIVVWFAASPVKVTRDPFPEQRVQKSFNQVVELARVVERRIITR